MSRFRNEDGDIDNPPVIPEFEQRLSAAISKGDQSEVDHIQNEYHRAREEEVTRLEEQERQQQQEQESEQDSSTGSRWGRN